MKPTIKSNCFLSIASLLLLASFATPCYSAQDQGHYIYQTSGIIGDQDIYITNNGIKIVNKSTGLVTIAKAPAWTVSTYHTKTKTLCSEPLLKFNGYIPEKEFVSTGQRWSKIPFTKSKSNIVAGVNSSIYTTTSSFTEKQIKDWSRQFADSKFIKSARYCVSQDLKVSPKARSVMCKFYGLKDLGGIPLEFKYHDLGGYLHVGLTTSSQKNLAKKILDLNIPKGFNKVKTHQELLSIALSTKKTEKKRRPLL